MKIKRMASGLAAAAVLAAFPVTAGSFSQAEKLRRLDIMLMVTGLRCRSTANNFIGEYGRFTANHMTELNAAADTMKQELRARYGAAGVNRALDRLSTQMANQYGQGHPWLNCGQLKQVAGSLADMRGAEPLAAAADEVLDTRSHGLAWLR